MSAYVKKMVGLIEDVYAGMKTYAETLEDLSGNVLDPIGEMTELTQGFDIPEFVDQDFVLSKLEEAEAGAEQYAEDLSDTTDCTYPLDEIAEHLENEG